MFSRLSRVLKDLFMSCSHRPLHYPNPAFSSKRASRPLPRTLPGPIPTPSLFPFARIDARGPCGPDFFANRLAHTAFSGDPRNGCSVLLPVSTGFFLLLENLEKVFGPFPMDTLFFDPFLFFCTRFSHRILGPTMWSGLERRNIACIFVFYLGFWAPHQKGHISWTAHRRSISATTLSPAKATEFFNSVTNAGLNIVYVIDPRVLPR